MLFRLRPNRLGLARPARGFRFAPSSRPAMPTETETSFSINKITDTETVFLFTETDFKCEY